MAKVQVYLMPFSHLDLFWLGEREECLSRGNRIISRAIDICEREPEFRFLLEDMVFVKNYLVSHPEKKEALARLVRKGQVEVAPKYAGIYASMIPGEAHVRNFLYGKGLARELLGVDPLVAHQGDLPAHTPQYPQILRKSDVPYAILCRLGPNQTPLFQWQGLDGSRCLTWYATRSYGWAKRLELHESVQAARTNGLEEQAREILGQTSSPILMHWGTDLYVPTEKLIENVRQWNQESDLKLRFSTPSEFFETVKDTPKLPVIEGESPNGWGMNGSDSFPGDGRFLDFYAVNALLNAERFATIANLLGYIDYPGDELDVAWMRLLESMDHNASGTGAQEGNRRHLEYRRAAIFAGEEVLRQALRPIAENVQVQPDTDSTPLVVFNGLSWDRTDIATAHISFYGEVASFHKGQPEKVSLVDSAGRQVPMQVLETLDHITREMKVVFLAEAVPSMGYKTYYVVPVDQEPSWPNTCQVIEDESLPERMRPYGPLRLETDRLTFTIERQSGRVSLFDKTSQRWVLEHASIVGEETDITKLRTFEHFPTGRRFELAVEKAELVENGPVRARVLVRGKIGTVTVEQEWLLYRGLRRLDLNVTTEAQGPMAIALHQTFPTTVEGGKANFGVPYGTNSFENVMPQLQPRLHNRDEANYEAWVNLREVQNWIDLSNDDFGVTVTTSHRLMEVKSPILVGKLAFVRIATEPRTYHFQIYPHEGDWRTSRSYRWGWQLSTPLSVLSVNDPFTEKRLPPEQSFYRVSTDDVVLVVLKRSQDRRRLVWRGYEAEGRAVTMALGFFRQLANLEKANLLEAHSSPVTVDHIPVDGHEIITLAGTVDDAGLAGGDRAGGG